MNSAYLHQPREISIETWAMCNAACGFCPYITLERRGEKLSATDVLGLIKQMKEWKAPFFISPFKVNEPFLDSRLLLFCRLINAELPLARLRIFSNGSRFNRDNVVELLALERVEHIWVSLNEVDPLRYKEVMRYVGFEHVADKIDLLHAHWLRRIAHRVFLSRVSEVSPALEAQRREEFDRYCGKRWPGFVTFHIKRDAWLGYTEPSGAAVPQAPCARWWELSICADGKAALCCMDGKAEFGVGSIYDSTLDELYNHPSLLRRRLDLIQRSAIAPCNRCTY